MSKNAGEGRLWGAIVCVLLLTICCTIDSLTSTTVNAANIVADMSQVNVWLFGQAMNNSRERELIRVLKPDIVHRGVYEWVGTELQDRNFDGVSQSISILQGDGIAVVGGVSAHWWAPKYETLAPGVNVSEAGYDANGDYCHIDPNTNSGMLQLIYKAKKQIDLGVDGIEFDEMYNQNNARAILTELKNYAASKGKKVFLSCNNYDGPAGVSDYNLSYLSCPTSNGRFDGSINNIPGWRSKTSAVPVPVVVFQDHSGSYTTGPSNAADYPAYLRCSYAQALAGGAFPGEFKSWMNSYDMYQQNCFSIVANLAKFMRENGPLWHNLSYIGPATLSASMSKVYMSAFGQTGRTILHLVNGNFTAGTQTMTAQSDFTVQIALSASPTRVWMTTPDKLSNTRRQILNYSFSGGVATISIPQLIYHDVVVIEQGSTYDPIYTAMQIKFPFPNPANIIAGNNFRFNAVQTEGWTSSFNWYVNNVAGGNSTYGTIDDNGLYRAPESPVDSVTVKAVSKDDLTVSASLTFSVVRSPSIPWYETFASDGVGSRPANWQVVEGNGDWRIDSDDGVNVLHNYNMSEGRVEQFQTGAGGNLSGALHEPMMAGGCNNLNDYTYTVAVKPVKTPYIWYGINSEKSDTYIGLLFRFKDYQNYYVYRWTYDGILRLYKMVNGVESRIGIDTVCKYPVIGNYTDLKVVVSGNGFAAYMGGSLIRLDRDSSIATGAIGCLSNMSENYFKNISVSAAEPLPTPTPVPPNLALNKVASADSSETANPATNGNDGNTNTRWCANNSNTGHWWMVDLGANQNLSGTQVIWEKSNAYQYKIDVSTDNANWTTVVNKTANTTAIQTMTDNFTAFGRYVRITITGGLSSTLWASFQEFSVFGANLALNKAASADSSETANPATNGNDGNTNSRWCANDSNTGHWWTVDLGANQNLTGTQVIWEKSNAYQYKIDVSTDNSTWTTVVDRSANSTADQTMTDNFSSSGRYVRITVTGGLSSTIWACFYEFNVFGAAGPIPSSIYQAETATKSSGWDVQTSGLGWSGTGFVDCHGTEGYIEYIVNVSTAGTYTLQFKYASADTGGRPQELKINGTIVESSLSFPSTGSWNSVWGAVISNQTLNAGNNTIRLTTKGGTAPNWDQLQF